MAHPAVRPVVLNSNVGGVRRWESGSWESRRSFRRIELRRAQIERDAETDEARFRQLKQEPPTAGAPFMSAKRCRQRPATAAQTAMNSRLAIQT